MQGERNLLHNYVMPILQQWCNSLHVQVWVKDASERNSNRAIILENNNKGFLSLLWFTVVGYRLHSKYKQELQAVKVTPDIHRDGHNDAHTNGRKDTVICQRLLRVLKTIHIQVDLVDLRWGLSRADQGAGGIIHCLRQAKQADFFIGDSEFFRCGALPQSGQTG